MSAQSPASITIKRVREDTYAEKFSVKPMPTNITAASLEVETLGTSAGVIDTVAQTIEFPVSAPIANGVAASYDYDVVITAGGTTRTLVQGKWIISERQVQP